MNPGRAGRLSQKALAGIGILAVLLGTALLGRGPAGSGFAPPPSESTWVYLSDLPWDRSSTEWTMVGNEGIPTVDGAFFTGGPLLIGSQAYVKGIGTHAPSEIVYQLAGLYSRLEVLAGVEDDGIPGEAGAQFLVFADGTKVYESPVLGAWDEPLPVRVPLYDVQELRLVTVRSQESLRGARVAWADARLLQGAAGLEGSAESFIAGLRESAAGRMAQRLAHERLLAAESGRVAQSLHNLLGEAFPGREDRPVAVTLDGEDSAEATLVNNRIAVTVALGGDRHGSISIVDLETGQFVVRGVAPSVRWEGGGLHLARDTRRAAENPRAEEMEHPVFGQGTRLMVPLEGRGADLPSALLEIAIFADHAVTLTRFEVEGVPETAGAIELTHLGGDGEGGLLVGERTHYLAEITRLRHVVAYDDGILHRDRIAWGKPVYFWDEKTSRGVLLAHMEESPLPPLFSFRRAPGEALAQISLETTGVSEGGSLASGWTYIEAAREATAQEQFSRYRALTAHLFPAPSLPDWVRHQWLSWYVYYMDISEDLLVEQIDLLAEHFSDLGPWHIIVDAGWYIAEGRDGSEWRNQDFEKFPRGLRWLVNYAHERGVRVVLYYTAPYLNTREEGWNWLGLRTLIEDHPDWVIALDDTEPYDDFAYDFQNPELRAYMAGVMRDYAIRYDVDGIKLDGLGSAGEAVIHTPEGSAFSLSDRALGSTLDIYRFVHDQLYRWKDDIYIESGWVNPVMAQPYSHTFRYGDEEPLFSRPYPLPGFMEHVDYSAYQQGLLGQRSNMGAVYGEPNSSLVNLWWLGAALAMGTQVSLSFNLAAMTPESISLYRSYLAAYRPFEGVTRIDTSLEQRLFSTKLGGRWFVGVLNRTAVPDQVVIDATTLGLPSGSNFFIFDVDASRAARAMGSHTVALEPESFRTLAIRTEPGLVWANSVVEPLPTDGSERLSFSVSAPPTVNGTLYIYAFETPTLYWDGLPLAASEDASGEPQGYTYDSQSGLITVWFPAGGDHTLTIE